MAFEEIKAKLGLDITAFQQNTFKAQSALKDLAGSATKKFTDIKNVGQTVATALGLNIENIAEGVARMVVGFSKTQEEALNRLVNRSKSAADEMSKIARSAQGGDDPQKRIELLDQELESVKLQAQARKTLTNEERLSIIARNVAASGKTVGLVKAYKEIQDLEDELARNQEQGAARLSQINLERLAAQQELKKKEKKDLDDASKNFADADEERRKRMLAQMSDEEQLKALKEEQAQALKDIDDTSKTTLQRSEALVKSEKLATEIQKTTNDIAKKATDAAAKQAQLKEDIAAIEAETAKTGKSDAEVKVMMEKELLDLIKKRDAESDETKQLELTKKIAEQKQKIAKFTADALQKQKALTKELETKQADLRAARIQEVKPTMEEVTSGKRNIGGRAFTAATALQQERENSLRLADQVQRDAEALDAAKGFNERAKAEAAFNASRTALFASQQRIKRGQEFLGNRVTDANPYATMEQELTSIKTELTKLNTQTLNPKAIK